MKYLYFMTCEEENLLKVGVSIDPFTRMKTLSSMYGINLELHSVFDVGKDYIKFERMIHESIYDENVRFELNENESGIEWFNLDGCNIEGELGLINIFDLKPLDIVSIDIRKLRKKKKRNYVNIPVDEPTRDRFKDWCDEKEMTYDKMLRSIMDKAKK